MNFIYRVINAYFALPILFMTWTGIAFFIAESRHTQSDIKQQVFILETEINGAAVLLTALIDAINVTTKTKAELLKVKSGDGLKIVDLTYPQRLVEFAVVKEITSQSNNEKILNVLHADEKSVLLKSKTELSLSNDVVANGSTGLFFLYPEKEPTHLVMVEQGPSGIAIASAIQLSSLLYIAESSSANLISFALHMDRSMYSHVHSPTWDSSNKSLEKSLNVYNDLKISARPSFEVHSPDYIENSNVKLLALFVTAIITIFVLYKYSKENNSNINIRKFSEIESTRKIVKKLCDSSGIMGWTYDIKKQFFTFGSWPEIGDYSERLLTEHELIYSFGLKENQNKFIDSLDSALALKEDWNGTFKQNIDGVNFNFQYFGIPLIQENGEYFGLIGVRIDLTSAFEIQSSTEHVDSKIINKVEFIESTYRLIHSQNKKIYQNLELVEIALYKNDFEKMRYHLSLGKVFSRQLNDSTETLLSNDLLDIYNRKSNSNTSY